MIQFAEDGRKIQKVEMKPIEEDESKKDDAKDEAQEDGMFAACEDFKPRLAAFLEHQAVQLLMFLVTIYALFGDDIRLLAFPRDADGTFTILNIIALALFLLELLIASVGKPDYFNSFFFWLDLISTLSIITDI